MEKKKIIFNYSNSGIKTLNFMGTVFLVIGICSSCMLASSFFDGDIIDNMRNVAGLFSSSMMCLSSFAFWAICNGLSNVAKTALYQKKVLEQQYEFEFGYEKATQSKDDDLEINGEIKK
jgi:cellulose synthase/poly-beta-1,6-N-acetylglucosamine synthase-like glycosyltransferase